MDRTFEGALPFRLPADRQPAKPTLRWRSVADREHPMQKRRYVGLDCILLMPLSPHVQDQTLQADDLTVIQAGEVRRINSFEEGVDMVCILQPYQGRVPFAFEG
jgi:hypothetical protein